MHFAYTTSVGPCFIWMKDLNCWKEISVKGWDWNMRQGKYRPRFRMHASPRSSFTFQQIAKRLSFPTNVTGNGITVGIGSLGGALNISRLASFLGFTPKIRIITLPGADTTSDPTGADVENNLDVIGIASVAPNVTINFYQGPNSTAGMIAIINRATADGCRGLSWSWGGPEDQSDVPDMEAAFAPGYVKGMLFTAAAGDNGSDDGESRPVTDYPACSRYCLACGGTTVASPVDTVWSDTGGGTSKIVAAPTWQLSDIASIHTTFRCTPDASGPADPNTGYNTPDGIVGGTSAVAPLMMGLWALLLESNGGKSPSTDSLAWFYSLPSKCWTDITKGSNGSYSAGAGYDRCAGMGEPIGTAIVTALLGGVVTPPTPPTPPVPPTPLPPPIMTGPTEMQLLNGILMAEQQLLNQHRNSPTLSAGIVLGARTALATVQNEFGN